MLDQVPSTKKIRGKMSSDDRQCARFTEGFNGPSMVHRKCKLNVEESVDQKDRKERKRMECLGNSSNQTFLRIF